MDSISQTSLDVAHDEEAARYQLTRSGEPIGVIDYRRSGDVLDLFHTETAPSVRGHGLGTVLVRGALDDVRARGLRVVPSCWFVREFIEVHDGYGDLLAD